MLVPITCNWDVQGAGWGWYTGAQLPGLIAWLERGSDAEQATADAVFEAFQDLLPSGHHVSNLSSNAFCVQTRRRIRPPQIPCPT